MQSPIVVFDHIKKQVATIPTGPKADKRLDELLASGHTLNHLDTGQPLSAIRDKVVSANAYLGAFAPGRSTHEEPAESHCCH